MPTLYADDRPLTFKVAIEKVPETAIGQKLTITHGGILSILLFRWG